MFVSIAAPPIVMMQNDVQAVTRGAPTVLHCPVLGDPPFTIVWTKDGAEVAMDGRHVLHENGTLAIYDSLVSVATSRAPVVGMRAYV